MNILRKLQCYFNGHKYGEPIGFYGSNYCSRCKQWVKL